MKKTFPLVSERHQPARLADLIRGEIRKYLKRERNKKLAEEFDYWDFDCRTGASSEAAVPCHEKEIGRNIDAAVATGDSSIYIEILAKAAKRNKSG